MATAEALPTHAPAQIIETINKGRPDLSPGAARDWPRATPEELAERLAMPADKGRKLLEIAKAPIRLGMPISGEEGS
jgi:DNA-directed RNA polymerase sigma subunit (sigma70/sigma32)